MRIYFRCAVAFLALLLTVRPASAQFETASVVGTVRDTSGALVPGATVTLTSVSTSQAVTRTSGSEGAYEFGAVRAGEYVVTAEKPGFAIALVDNVQVEVGARLRVDLQMSVGQISEKVQVSAASPLIETDTSQRGQVINGAQIVALPLNGREYSSLALLTSGVRQAAIGRIPGTPREGSFNVNGLRSVFNNYLIDGVDNNSYGTSNQGFSNQVMQPPPDAVAEFKVVTNNESAEYGRSAGATINVAYKSGGNQIHGSGWEFHRDDSLNAIGYYKPVDGQKPPLNRNQYGGVVGGPILKDRAFYFADFEGFRQTRGAPAFSTVPSGLEQQGILSVDVRDPRTGVTYPAGTRIPMTAFAATVLQDLPDPNVGTAANNYTLTQQFTNHTDKAGGKVDYRFSPAVSAFGRYGWRRLATEDQPPIPNPSGGGGNGSIYARNKQLVVGGTWVRNSSSMIEARFGWSKTLAGKNPLILGSGSALDAYGIPGLSTDPRITGGFPTQNITGYTELGRQSTNPQWQYPSIYDPKLNYLWTMGRQSLKAGYEFQAIQVEVMDVNPLYGRDFYAGQFTRPAGAASSNLYNLADFMLGLRSQYNLANALVAQMRQHLHFTYVQDDYRVGDRLTLNLGLRYEYATPMWEADNVLTNFDPTTRTMVAAKDGSLADRALVNPDRNNFGPRLGLAYTAAARTVVKGGWGVSYVHVNRPGGANLLPINGPQVINATVNQTPADAVFLTTQQGYPTDLTSPAKFNPLAANVSYIPRDFQSGRVQSWFASVQQQIGSNMSVDIAYVGNRGDGLLMLANYNQAFPNNPAGSLSLQARRPIPEFSDISYVFNGGKSRYKALQLKYQWRARSNVSLLSSLTLSEAKDNAAGSLENYNGNYPGPQDFRNIDADYSYSGNHQPYNSTTSVVWSLPFGRGHRWGANVSPMLDALIGGWQLAGINTMTSGEPVTVYYTPGASFAVSGISNDFRGANNYRPNLVGDPYPAAGQQSPTNWFNKDAFVIPTDPSQPFGNAPRNVLRGPRFAQFDLAVSKQVAVGAGTRLEVRIETFNLFDRANFTFQGGTNPTPNLNRSNAAFGTFAGTFDPRQIQLGVKVLW